MIWSRCSLKCSIDVDQSQLDWVCRPNIISNLSSLFGIL
jgi:hypothetical protein